MALGSSRELTVCASNVGIAAACVGPPFRMALSFNEPDAERLRLKRTLCQQELFKAGVINI